MSLRKKPEADPSKKLKIQIGICKRMLKEVAAYEKEVIDNEARIQKMRDDGKDPYDIKKQEEVLQESYMMVPDSKSRCEAAIGELKSILDEIGSGDSADANLQIDEAMLAEANEIVSKL